MVTQTHAASGFLDGYQIKHPLNSNEPALLPPICLVGTGRFKVTRRTDACFALELKREDTVYFTIIQGTEEYNVQHIACNVQHKHTK